MKLIPLNLLALLLPPTSFYAINLQAQDLRTSDSYSLDEIKILCSSIDKEFDARSIDKKIQTKVVGYNFDKSATLYLLNSLSSFVLTGDSFSFYSFERDINVLKLEQDTPIIYNEISRLFTFGFDYEKEEKENSLLSTYSSDGDKKCELIDAGNLKDHTDKFFPGGTFFAESKINEFQGFSQGYLSCYSKNGSSEGNCTTTAAFTVLRNFADDGYYSAFSVLPKNLKTKYNPRIFEYDTYKYVKSLSDNYTFYDDSDRAAKDFDDLYIVVRQEAIKMSCTYMVDGKGLNFWQTSGIMEETCKRFGLLTFDGYETIDYNAYVGTTEFKETFENHKPILLFVKGCRYGSHAIAVFGYRSYRRTVQQLFWTKEEWSTILLVKDGWSTETRYFDITHYMWDDKGWGAITCFRW